MNVIKSLDIPIDVIARIATGEYERTGGVIHDNTDKVVLWLREGSVVPNMLSELTRFLTPGLKEMMKLTSLAPSALGLGATTSISPLLLAKLDKIDKKLDIITEKLDEIDRKIDKLQWTVDIGFANTLQSLDLIKNHQEITLAGELVSAINLAWSCQFIEPESNKRIMRTEQAFSKSSSVLEKLLLHTESEMNDAIHWMENKRSQSFDFEIDDLVIKALYRFRQTCIACSVNANIQAETGDIYSVGVKLHKDQEKLLELLYRLMNKAIEGYDGQVYLSLLSEKMIDVAPIDRIELWVNRFDNEHENINDLFELLRAGSGNSRVNSPFAMALVTSGFWGSINDSNVNLNDNTATFFNLVDGLYEDLGRLKGSAIEYKAMDAMDTSIHNYREELSIDNVEFRDKLMCISPV